MCSERILKESSELAFFHFFLWISWKYFKDSSIKLGNSDVNVEDIYSFRAKASLIWKVIFVALSEISMIHNASHLQKTLTYRILNFYKKKKSSMWKINFKWFYTGEVKNVFSFFQHGEHAKENGELAKVRASKEVISWFYLRNGCNDNKDHTCYRPCDKDVPQDWTSLFCSCKRAVFCFGAEHCKLWHCLKVLEELLWLRITIKWANATVIIPLHLYIN